MSQGPSSTPDEPDLAILLVAANRVLVDRLQTGMADAGLTMRPKWGFVIRALHRAPVPLAELARLLDVTKQAAQQTVDEMESAELVVRQPDPRDGRRKLITLTAQGQRVRDTALGISADLEAEIGESHATALRAALLKIVERHGDLEQVQARRSRALWH